MPSELLVVHVGQCGVQVASSYWELLCLEHSVSLDGELDRSDKDSVYSDVFFQEVNNGRVIPRCIILDGEASVIDEIRNGAYRNLFYSDHLINSIDDSANNFGRGSFLVGAQCIIPFRKSLRKLTEQVDRLNELISIQSISGGSGSGLGALLLQEMQLQHPKVARIQFALFPSPVMSSSVVETYNALFHCHTTIETCDLSIYFDNEAFYSICQDVLGINAPNFSMINRLLSVLISSASSSMRFSNTLTAGIQEIYTNLIPYPRIHYCVMAHAPLCPAHLGPYLNPTVESITKQVLSKEYLSLKCDTTREKFISVMLNFRGNVTPIDIGECIKKCKTNNLIKLVEWCPTGFKVGLNNQCPIFVPESLINFSTKSVTMIANSAGIRSNFDNLSRKFDLLFAHRTFVHWFINEGIEETEFGESRIDMQLLSEDYVEITMSESELMEQIETNPTKRERSFSVRKPDNGNEKGGDSVDE